MLRELLADTFGATSSTAIADSLMVCRIRVVSVVVVKNTLHLPPLAFPTAVGALAQPPPLRLGLGVVWHWRRRM